MKSDNPMVKYLLIFAAIGVLAILGADAVNEGDPTGTMKELVSYLTPIGAVLFVIVKQDEVKATVEKGLNGDLDKRIETAVRKVLDEYTKPRG